MDGCWWGLRGGGEGWWIDGWMGGAWYVGWV